MSRQVDRAEFERLFETFEHSAWRLECQGAYNEPEEREPLRRWLSGEPDDLTWFADWPAWIAEQRHAGRTIGRVRITTEPLTDYLRWELAVLTPPAIAAGEDIRLLSAARFAEMGIPAEDFWIFDSTTVAVLRFGPGGVTSAAILADDGSFRDRQRRAWDASVPYR